MQVSSPNSRQHRRRINLYTYTIVFWLIVISVGTYIYYNISIDPITELILKQEDVSFLLVIEEDGLPVATNVVLLNTANKAVGLLDIPVSAGNVLPSLKRSDRYSTVYKTEGIDEYRQTLANLLGMDFGFVITIKLTNFIRLIDLLEGLKLHIPFDLRQKLNNHYYWLDAGVQQLDGDKVAEYLTLPEQLYPNNSAIEALQPHSLAVVTSLLLTLQKINSKNGLSYAKFFWKISNTDLDKRSFMSLFQYLAEGEYADKSFVYQKYLGNERTVQGQRIIFPMYNGELLKERMKWVRRSLANTVKEEGLAIEILNGTSRARLAANTADIYRSYGYRVLQIGNASSEQEETMVIGFVNASEVENIADLINCDNIEYRKGISDQDILVRIVLGKDFNGRYVIR